MRGDRRNAGAFLAIAAPPTGNAGPARGGVGHPTGNVAPDWGNAGALTGIVASARVKPVGCFISSAVFSIDTMQLKFRRLDQNKDWMFFHEKHSLASEQCMEIHPLEDASARMLWTEFVSPNPRERHPMLLPADHWIGNVTAVGPDWHAVWNASDVPDSVADFLRSRVPWPASTEVIFCWSRENAVQVQWGMFLHAWKTFLYDDEGPFLMCLQRPEFVCFGPTGGIGVGLRTGPCLLAAED